MPQTPPRKPTRKPPPAPYLSTTPWTGFTAHDRPRKEPLPVCPAAACRRARQCIRATDDLYCRRTHLTLSEMIHAARKPGVKPAPWPRLGLRPTEHQQAAFRMFFDVLTSREKAKSDAMKQRWKAGEFGDRYGKYDPKGVLMQPPPKIYVDEREG